ncbi:FAD-dependent monooxygenase [Sphingomonas bacterium]|uniref:FAD-dependent monooxygenase n=1 Tax=Sphingomonas bacterium TaxID=1895847 RepID=UPI001575F697|nr:FAD-dependent monooxygenase [Sphingomonas bacterium]
MRDQSADTLTPSRDEILVRAARFAPAVGCAVAATPAERLIPFVIYARKPPQSLGSGRLIRVGDAAHAMGPNLGQGTCQAIEDAVALGAVAATSPVEDILASYERLRLKLVAGIVRRAAEGRHGAHGPLAVQWAMRSLLRLMPAGISDRLARSIQTMPAYAD